MSKKIFIGLLLLTLTVPAKAQDSSKIKFEAGLNMLNSTPPGPAQLQYYDPVGQRLSVVNGLYFKVFKGDYNFRGNVGFSSRNLTLNEQWESDTVLNGTFNRAEVNFGVQGTLYEMSFFSLYGFGEAMFFTNSLQQTSYRDESPYLNLSIRSKGIGLTTGLGLQFLFLKRYSLFIESGLDMYMQYSHTLETNAQSGVWLRSEYEPSLNSYIMLVNMAGIGFRF